MKLKIKNGLYVAVSLLLSAPVLAQDAEQAADNGWSGKGELGFVSTSGNTDTTTLKFGIEFIREMEKWRHRFGANALNAEDTGTTTAERYGLEWQSDYKLSEMSWIFGSFRYESDKFGAYDNQQTITAGYGRKLIDTEVSQLVGEIGVGYRDAEDRLTGISNSEAIMRGLLDYTRQITGNTEFTNRFLVESGSDNTFIQNLTALSVAMNDKFALKLGFEYRNNSDVPPGVDDTDTITSANLVYNF